jgi:hypothetical protein
MSTSEPGRSSPSEPSDLNLLITDSDDSILVIVNEPGDTTPGPMHPNTPLGWFPRPVFRRPRDGQEPKKPQE